MIDLHTHSNVSDGSDRPERVAELAAEAGLSAFALTDHDSLDGIAAARGRAGQLGVELVPGCELSIRWSPGTFHLLVYFVERDDGPLQEALADLQQARDDRNRVMIERLAGLGLPVTWAEVDAEAGGEGMGRPHVAAVLVRNGAVSSIQEAFDQWLAKGRPGYVAKARLSAQEGLRLATAAGAVPVVAHPLSLGLEGDALDNAVAELAGFGLAGMEATYGRYSPEERQGLAAIARRHGLVVTGGSDYHGTYKPDLVLGRGTGDLQVPDDAVDQLRARRR